MKAEKKDVAVELLDTADVSLIAIQGPRAAATLQAVTLAPVHKLPFMSSTETTIGKMGFLNTCRFISGFSLDFICNPHLLKLAVDK